MNSKEKIDEIINKIDNKLSKDELDHIRNAFDEDMFRVTMINLPSAIFAMAMAMKGEKSGLYHKGYIKDIAKKFHVNGALTEVVVAAIVFIKVFSKTGDIRSMLEYGISNEYEENGIGSKDFKAAKGVIECASRDTICPREVEASVSLLMYENSDSRIGGFLLAEIDSLMDGIAKGIRSDLK